jgi:hypothetical protein
MVTTARGRAFWEQHVNALRSSGQTSKDYARDHELSVHALGWWRRKLHPRLPKKSAGAAVAPKASKFVALKLTGPMATQPLGVTVSLPGEVRLQMADLPPPTWLAEVIQAMRGSR